MAEIQKDSERDSCRAEELTDCMDLVVPVNRKKRRGSGSDQDLVPPNKSPRNGDFSSEAESSEVMPATDGMEMQTENIEDTPRDTPARRKSWRRSTLVRRSLPFLPNPYQTLCRDISTSIPDHERLDKLMEASMKLAIDRLHETLQSVPNSSMEAFQQRVDCLTKECASLAKSPKSDGPSGSARSGDPKEEKIIMAINRLKAESKSWEMLLEKHRSKAEELKRKVTEGPVKIGSIDDASVAQSSQYQLIKDKPNYCDILSRQQPMLQTMEIIMDTQSKMVRELLSIKEQSHLLIKETSVRLAKAAGFQDIPHDPFRKLLGVPVSSKAQ